MKSKGLFVLRKSFLGVLVLFSTVLYGQDPEFTQFYANPMYLNPAFAGSASCPRVVLNFRDQWPNTGTYITTSISYDQYFDFCSGGLGFQFVNDRAGDGTLVTYDASLVYAYNQPITKDMNFSIGLQMGYHQKLLDVNKLTFADQIDPNLGFIKSVSAEVSSGRINSRTNPALDVSAGALFYSKYLFAGFSTHHIMEPDESFYAGNNGGYLPRKYTAHLGGAIPIGKGRRYVRRGDFENAIYPNILYQQQQDFKQLNLGIYANKGPMVGGIWYRNNDSFILLVGIKQEKFKIGYSYDVTISKLGANTTAGAHEISYTQMFNCPKPKIFRPNVCPSL